MPIDTLSQREQPDVLTQKPPLENIAKALAAGQTFTLSTEDPKNGESPRDLGTTLGARELRAIMQHIADVKGIPVDSFDLEATFSLVMHPAESKTLPASVVPENTPTQLPEIAPPAETPEPTRPPEPIATPEPVPTPLPSWLNADPEATVNLPNGSTAPPNGLTSSPESSALPPWLNTMPPSPRPTETTDLPTNVPPSETPTPTPEAAWAPPSWLNTDTTPTSRLEPTATLPPSEPNLRTPWITETPPNGSGSEPTRIPFLGSEPYTGVSMYTEDEVPDSTDEPFTTGPAPETPPATTSLDIDYTPPADTQPAKPEAKGPIPLVIPLEDGETATPAEIAAVTTEIEDVQDSGKKRLEKFFSGIKIGWKKFGRKIGCIGLVAIMGACAYNLSPEPRKTINRDNVPTITDAGPQFGPPEPPTPEAPKPIDLSTSADTSAITSNVDRPNRPNVPPVTETPAAAVENTSMIQELAVMKVQTGANIDSTMRSGVDQQFRNRSDVSEQTKASIAELLKEMNLVLLNLTEEAATRMQPNETVYYSAKMAEAIRGYYEGQHANPVIATLVKNDQEGRRSTSAEWQAAFDFAKTFMPAPTE